MTDPSAVMPVIRETINYIRFTDGKIIMQDDPLATEQRSISGMPFD